MGDRGNIVIIQDEDNEQVWLYTHWGGHRISEATREGLIAGKGRWSDPSYLTRIILNALQGDERGETGFGISTRLGDNEYPIVVVDCPRQNVYTISEKQLINYRVPARHTSADSNTFEEIASGLKQTATV